MQISDVSFDDATDVHAIAYRIAPLDVGFDLRVEKMAIAVNRTDDPIRISYSDAHGERRVIEGPQTTVLRRLRRLGYRFDVR